MKSMIRLILALTVILMITAVVMVMHFDVNAYKPQIIEALNRQIGRSVRLEGPLAFGLSRGGLTLSIENASIGNPVWASRKDLAGVGKFELGIAFFPLLRHQLVITDITLKNADILFETNGGGEHNWDLSVASTSPTRRTASPTPLPANTSSGQSVTVLVDHLHVTDSQLALRDAMGSLTTFATKDLIYDVEDQGAVLHFDGTYNGSPVILDAKAVTNDLMAKGPWPLTLDLAYGPLQFHGQGRASLEAKLLDLVNYKLKIGKSVLEGKLTINVENRTDIRGEVSADRLDLADLKGLNAPEAQASLGTSANKSAPDRVFSDAPLGLANLKSVDTAITFDINELVAGEQSLTQIRSRLEISGGHLAMPVTAKLGRATVSGEIQIDGSVVPPTLTMSFAAPGSNLADLLHLLGAPAFLSGTAYADLDIASSGDSPHAIAENANGRMNVLAEGGSISTGTLDDLSSGLAQLLSAGQSSHLGLNCLAARFIVTKGLMRDNGILVDTTATTVSGNGGFDLGAETINLVLKAKTKAINVASVLPALKVKGTLRDPGFSADPTDIVQNVVGILTSGSLDNGVPDMQSAAGQNACVYTLDHAVPASSATHNVLQPGVAGQVQRLQKAGGNILKGLLGQ